MKKPMDTTDRKYVESVLAGRVASSVADGDLDPPAGAKCRTRSGFRAWLRRSNCSKIPLTYRHEKAVYNHSLELPVSDLMYEQLESAGLVEQRGGEWALTERGCDLAAGRLTIKRGRVVRK